MSRTRYPHEPAGTQNSRFWNPVATEPQFADSMHIGGSARGYQELPHPLTTRPWPSRQQSGRMFMHCQRWA